jgi:hypothetical protein
MQVFDEDSVKDIKAEERAYTLWEREQKNRIFAMSNVQRKQAAWNKLFPQVEHSDDYLNGLIY